MNLPVEFFLKRIVLFTFLAFIISTVIALSVSKGSANFGIWVYSLLFMMAYAFLSGYHLDSKKTPIRVLSVALALQSIIVFIASFLVGSEDNTIGYSDEAVSDFHLFFGWVRVIMLLLILITLLISAIVSPGEKQRIAD